MINSEELEDAIETAFNYIIKAADIIMLPDLAFINDLGDIAMKKGIYSRRRCKQVQRLTQRLTDDIEKIQAKISAMQKKLKRQKYMRCMTRQR